MRPGRWWLAAVVLLGAAGGGCSYDPHFADGTLKCSAAGECPQGYSCTSGACYANASPTKSDAGTPAGDAALGGDAISMTVRDRYIGNWTLALTSSVATQCDDGFNDTSLLSTAAMPSVMKMAAGIPATSDLESDWLCKLSLRLDSAGAHLFDATPTCSASGTNMVQTRTWTATRFEFVTNDGITAMHTAGYNRVDAYTNGSQVNCTQMVTATLTKN